MTIAIITGGSRGLPRSAGPSLYRALGSSSAAWQPGQMPAGTEERSFEPRSGRHDGHDRITGVGPDGVARLSTDEPTARHATVAARTARMAPPMNASGIRLIERRNSRHRHRRGGSRPAAKLVKVAESGLSATGPLFDTRPSRSGKCCMSASDESRRLT
jgi:hypothetical protein